MVELSTRGCTGRKRSLPNFNLKLSDQHLRMLAALELTRVSRFKE